MCFHVVMKSKAKFLSPTQSLIGFIYQVSLNIFHFSGNLYNIVIVQILCYFTLQNVYYTHFLCALYLITSCFWPVQFKEISWIHLWKKGFIINCIIEYSLYFDMFKYIQAIFYMLIQMCDISALFIDIKKFSNKDLTLYYHENLH